jgi:hypothetical protein
MYRSSGAGTEITRRRNPEMKGLPVFAAPNSLNRRPENDVRITVIHVTGTDNVIIR